MRGIIIGLHEIDAHFDPERPDRFNGTIVRVCRKSPWFPGYHSAKSLVGGHYFLAAKVHFIGDGGAA